MGENFYGQGWYSCNGGCDNDRYRWQLAARVREPTAADGARIDRCAGADAVRAQTDSGPTLRRDLISANKLRALKRRRELCVERVVAGKDVVELADHDSFSAVFAQEACKAVHILRRKMQCEHA